MGADVCTCPAAVIEQMFKHPLTDIGLEKFLKDWEKAQAVAKALTPRATEWTRTTLSPTSSAAPSSAAATSALRAAARRRQADRARAHRPAVRSRHVRGGRQARHPPLPRLRHGRRRSSPATASSPAHGRVDGRAGLRLRAGLHRLRRIALGDQRREDRQDHGPGDEDGRAGRRPERLGRRAHPGRRALARRLRRHLPAQHARLRRRSRRSPRSWARAPAAPSTRRRSPTSTSWSRARATCS